MGSLPLGLLVVIFAAGGAGVWLAGIKLSDATDVLATRLGLGEALGGLILLAIATNLPEVAIVTSAGLAGNLGIAIGNILGGIAIQTVVLVALDAFGTRREPLTYRAASLVLLLEAGLVIATLVVVIMASRLPPGLKLWRVGPGGLAVTVLWAVGLWLLGRARRGLPWHDTAGDAPDTQEKPRGHSQVAKGKEAADAGVSTARTAVVFAVAAVVTLAGGVLLERSGESIAAHIGMSGVLFGSTVLAAATSLPEVSTGLASVRMGDYQLAMSDIFGGNAFLPVLFLLASLLSGEAVLPQAKATDIYLTGLGALLTSVYIWGLVFRPRRRLIGMGVDSAVVLVLYLVGLAGLVAIAVA